MKKKLIFIIIPLIILIVFFVLFIKYKNLKINIDIIQPGVATITEDPINGRNIILYEEGYTTIDINIKEFFNVKVYPIIDNENIIYFDEENNKLIAKSDGEATIYFETLFGFSKSNELKITVLDKEIYEYEQSVKEAEKNELDNNKISGLSNNNKLSNINFVNNTLGKASEIYLQGETINIDNFILNGRTYIDIYDFCTKINCTIEKKDNTLQISKMINDVKFIVSHEIKTDTFKTTIQNGNQVLDYDIGSKYIDVKSCPSDGWECNENTVYVPLRFLMQAFGYNTTWNQENMNIAINDYIQETFKANYKIMVTDSIKNPGDKIENNASFQENKQLYLYATDSNNIITNYQIVLSFSDSSIPNGQNTDSIFDINGNNIKLLDEDNISNSKIKILVIQNIWDSNDLSRSGDFPIIIDFDINNYEVTETGDLGIIEEVDKSGGYPRTYTVRGHTFKEYRQGIPPYNSVPYWGSTIGWRGCGPVALSIICSGYTEETPATVAKYMDSAHGGTGAGSLSSSAQHFGFNTEIVYFSGSNDQIQKLKNHLLNGGLALISVCTPDGGCQNSPAESYNFAATSHIIAILNIDPNNTDSIYISNPAITKKTGWQSIDVMSKFTQYYILISKGD